MRKNATKLTYVVIDDDPTGCQTVHDIDVLLTNKEEAIEECIKNGEHFFILTNSRSMLPENAYKVNVEIAKSLKKYGDHIRIISRSDSTLRGYFKEEIDGITSVFGTPDSVIVVPAFFEGARITRDGIHYIKDNEKLIPVDQTEFATDRDFGFSTAYLPDWIEEKTNGKIIAAEVISISIDDIDTKAKQPELKKLREAVKGSYVVLNVENYDQLEHLISAISLLESEGKRYLYRSAASLVKTRLDISDHPFYIPIKSGNTRLIVVGSYVKKTTQQLAYLLSNAKDLEHIEIKINKVIDRFSEYQSEVSNELNNLLNNNKSVVVYTERDHWNKGEEGSTLSIHARVADFLSSLVSSINTRPGFIIAKGGITSHELAANGLKVSKAKVMGQLMPGVPVWKLYDGKYPEMDYVVFPGNVGTETSLFDAYIKLSGYVKN